MNRAERRQAARDERRLRSDPRMQRELAMRRQRQRQQEAKLPLDGDQISDLCVFATHALFQLVHGNASEDEIHHMSYLANVAMLFAERGLGHEYLEDIKAGQQAVVSIYGRFERIGKVGATGPELQAIRQLINVHEAQLEAQPSRKEMLDIIATIRAAQHEGQTA